MKNCKGNHIWIKSEFKEWSKGPAETYYQCKDCGEMQYFPYDSQGRSYEQSKNNEMLLVWSLIGFISIVVMILVIVGIRCIAIH